MALECARIAQDQLADDILILDLTDIESASFDYFVLCSGNSGVHVRAIVEALRRRTKVNVDRLPVAEGAEAGVWVILDFFDVVVHVMQEETRKFYGLERLWGDARSLRIDDEGQLVA